MEQGFCHLPHGNGIFSSTVQDLVLYNNSTFPLIISDVGQRNLPCYMLYILCIYALDFLSDLLTDYHHIGTTSVGERFRA